MCVRWEDVLDKIAPATAAAAESLSPPAGVAPVASDASRRQSSGGGASTSGRPPLGEAVATLCRRTGAICCKKCGAAGSASFMTRIVRPPLFRIFLFPRSLPTEARASLELPLGVVPVAKRRGVQHVYKT